MHPAERRCTKTTTDSLLKPLPNPTRWCTSCPPFPAVTHKREAREIITFSVKLNRRWQLRKKKEKKLRRCKCVCLLGFVLQASAVIAAQVSPEQWLLAPWKLTMTQTMVIWLTARYLPLNTDNNLGKIEVKLAESSSDCVRVLAGLRRGLARAQRWKMSFISDSRAKFMFCDFNLYKTRDKMNE